jgi:hypothetical protein
VSKSQTRILRPTILYVLNEKDRMKPKPALILCYSIPMRPPKEEEMKGLGDLERFLMKNFVISISFGSPWTKE